MTTHNILSVQAKIKALICDQKVQDMILINCSLVIFCDYINE